MKQIELQPESTCPHNNIERELVKDYHQHWEGFEVRCSECNKLIRYEDK